MFKLMWNGTYDVCEEVYSKKGIALAERLREGKECNGDIIGGLSAIEMNKVQSGGIICGKRGGMPFIKS